MRYAALTLAAALVLSLSACTRRPPDEQHVTGAEPTSSVDRDIAAQNRINSFLYVAVLPKVQGCWGRLQGKGDVTFKYTYRRSGTNWIWAQQEVESSTLPDDQRAVAQQCMQDAVRDTSFPMEATEMARGTPEMILHWAWPVPFPSDMTALGRMIDTGGGGKECPKSCVTCSCPFTPGAGVTCSCASSCSGYTPPCNVDANQKGCTMKLPACATGRLGGFGSVVIARAR